MTRDFKQVWLVASRELRDQMRDWRIIFPMIALTVFFPFLMYTTARLAVDFVNKYGAGLVGARMVPFLLMVVGFFPGYGGIGTLHWKLLSERKNAAPSSLSLSSPLEDWHLYVGKLIAGTIVPLIAAYLGISVYFNRSVGIGNSSSGFFDAGSNANTDDRSGNLMVSGAMVISAQSTSVRGANLLASFIVIPVALAYPGRKYSHVLGNESNIMAGSVWCDHSVHFANPSWIGAL